MGTDVKETTGSRKKMELLNFFFATLLTQKEETAQLIKSSTEGNRIVIQVKIDKALVREYLSTLDEHKSPGPDGLHARNGRR